MAHVLPDLPYAYDALAPHISEETLKTHHKLHHGGYFTKLNGFLANCPELISKSLEELIKHVDISKSPGHDIFNNAAQAWNHTFYFQSMAKGGGGEPTGELKKKIDEDFGSFGKFKEEFSKVAAGHFGSGWAWLVCGKNDGKLKVMQTHDAGNPLRDGTGTPLLTCDVWEHAYYIDYRNRRPDYIAAWWNLVNWEFANKNFANASSEMWQSAVVD